MIYNYFFYCIRSFLIIRVLSKKAELKASITISSNGKSNIKTECNKGLFFIGILLFCSCHSLFAQTSLNFTYSTIMSDAMVKSGGAETDNFGSQGKMNIFYQSEEVTPIISRTFIQYDLTTIPKDAIIINAKLRINAHSVDSSQNHSIYIERVENTAWSEETITWGNQPGVITTDQIQIPHEQVSATGVHEFDVVNHVQHMVSHPALNNGWRFRLQNEGGSGDYGIIYHSSEATDTANRPVLNITYIIPIKITTTVNHCSAGNTDGAMRIVMDGGSSYDSDNFFFYKTNRDLSERGKATITNYKEIGNFVYNEITKTATVKNLEPGIYVLKVLDDEYYTNLDPRLAFFQHILVGRYGEVTSGILYPSNAYQDYVAILNDKSTNPAPIGRATTNYASSNHILRVADAPNNYEFASLMRYRIDFDDQLEFSKAEIQMKASTQFYRGYSSSNAVNFSRLTSDWDEYKVTWSTRPSIDSTSRITIPTTTTIGYDFTHTWDTVSILPFVNHWLNYPKENYGFEMALETYGASQYALRSYKGQGNNVNYIEFEFTPKPLVTTVFDDATNRGTLTVNAPSDHPLPYTFLIDTKPLGTLASIWSEIGGSTLIDSADFFTGDIRETVFTFDGLPSGKYYVGVYDNTGTKIVDGNGIVNTKIRLYNDTNLDLSSSNVISRSAEALGDGTGRLYAELLADDSRGGLNFTIETLGDFYVGFNKTSDAVVKSATDLEFGIKVDAYGVYAIIDNNVLLASAAGVMAGQEISILREHHQYVIYIDETEIYRGAVVNLEGENSSIDFVLKDEGVGLKIGNYWNDFRKVHSGVHVDYPQCGEDKGAVAIGSGEIGTITSISLVNNDGTSPNPFHTCTEDGSYCSFPTVPIGTYTLTIAYNLLLGGEITTTEQVAIGYVVEWEEMMNNHVLPLNTIRKGPGPIIPVGWGTANSTNITIDDYKNWVQFETDVTSPFVTSLNREKLMLRSQAGEVSYELETALIPGTAIAYQGEIELDGAPIMLGYGLVTGPNGVWRLEQEDEVYELFKNNESILSVNSNAESAEPPYEIAIQQNGSAQYLKTIASFCNNYPVTDQYIAPKREIEGGYYVVPNDDSLRFEFNEEYALNDNDGKLKYEVLDFAGVSQNYLLADLTEVYGDNRFVLDVSGLSEGVYMLEIVNDKGENWFLRFKK